MGGSTESTGNGAQSNGSTRINWTAIIVVVLVGVGLYLIPSPFQSKEVVQVPSHTSSTQTHTSGIPDTTYQSSGPVVGNSYNTVQVSEPTYVATLPDITIKAMPDIVETLAVVGAKETESIQGIIRATAIPWIDNDTLRIEQWIEYNLEPKPIAIITQIDTLKYIDSVWIQEPTPFIEKPEVVATGVSIFWALILIIVI